MRHLCPPFLLVRFGAFFAGAPNTTTFVFPTTIVFRVVNMGTMGTRMCVGVGVGVGVWVWVWVCGCGCVGVGVGVGEGEGVGVGEGNAAQPHP